jgi:hypothetical protein
MERDADDAEAAPMEEEQAVADAAAGPDAGNNGGSGQQVGGRRRSQVMGVGGRVCDVCEYWQSPLPEPDPPLPPSLPRQFDELSDDSSPEDDGLLHTVEGELEREHMIRTLNHLLRQRQPRSPQQAAAEAFEARRRSLETQFFVGEREHAVGNLAAGLRENTGCSSAETRQWVEKFTRHIGGNQRWWDLAKHNADLILNEQANVGLPRMGVVCTQGSWLRVQPLRLKERLGRNAFLPLYYSALPYP